MMKINATFSFHLLKIHVKFAVCYMSVKCWRLPCGGRCVYVVVVGWVSGGWGWGATGFQWVPRKFSSLTSRPACNVWLITSWDFHIQKSLWAHCSTLENISTSITCKIMKHQEPIVHMSRQQSWHGMCTNRIWFDKSTKINNFMISAHKPFSKWGFVCNISYFCSNIQCAPVYLPLITHERHP